MAEIVGHAGNMLGKISDHDERTSWEKILQGPMPKLLSGYECAANIFRAVAHVPEKTIARDEWYKAFDCSSPETPIEGRMFMLPPNAPTFEASQASVDTTLNILDDLQKLGCYVASAAHKIYDRKVCMVTLTQYGLFLPFMKYDGTGKPPKRDIEGAAIFLAYLLDKNLVTESDIPKDDCDEHGHPLKNIAFGPAILTLAKSPSIQDKIRSLHADYQPGLQK